VTTVVPRRSEKQRLCKIFGTNKVHYGKCGSGVLGGIDVVVQFYPWFKFYFLLFLGMVMYDNEFETKEEKTQDKDKIEPQHIYTVITGP